MGFDGVLRGSKKGLDTKMLLDPFEEQFHLPSAAIELSDGQWRQHEVVGKKDQRLVGYGVVVLDASQFSWVMLGGIETGQHDSLIASEPRIFLDGVGIETATLEVGLGAYHEECRALTELIESLEIQVTSIHNVEGPWFRDQVIEDIDVVKLAVAYIDERRDAAAQIQECV